MEVVTTVDPLLDTEDSLGERKPVESKLLEQRSCREIDLECEPVCKDKGKDTDSLKQYKISVGYGFSKVTNIQITIYITFNLLY